jgi:autotransporter-associated beta strand protein
MSILVPRSGRIMAQAGAMPSLALSNPCNPMKIKLILLFVITLGLAWPTRGAVRFWEGDINGNLSTPGNWVGSVAPVAGDDLIFQPGVPRLLVTNDFSPNRAFNSITFQGSNYFLRGNAILLTNGILTLNAGGTNHVDADVTVRASQPWEAQGPLSVLDVNGDIALGANTLTVRANTGDFFFSGVITGTGNLVKTNVGTLRMDGSGHNTYSGFTRMDGGVLELNKFSVVPVVTNFTAIPGALTIGDGNGLVGTDVLRLLRDDQIADTSDLTVRNSGLFDLNDNTDRIGSLTMQGGTVDSGTGALILGGNITTFDDDNTAFINGNLSLGGASRTFDVNSGEAAADLRINAVISGGSASLVITPGFTKTGGGSLFLAATNTYNGITTVADGQLAVLSDRALGATTTPVGGSARTVVSGNGNLFLSGVQVTNEDLTISSTNSGGAFNASGASIWTGDILLNTNTFISSSGSLLLNGAITGPGGFTKLSSGFVTLGGTNANTYSGTTIVRDGTLLLDKDTTPSGGAMSGPLIIGEDELPEGADIVRFLATAQLPSDTDVTINASGLLDLNGFGQNVSDIILNGGDIDAPSPGSILPTDSITVNRNTNSQAIISGRMSVLSNPIIDVTGHFFSPDLSITAQLFGAGGFTKNGVGEVGLNSANTYSGQTAVNDGFVLVNDSMALGSTAGGTIVNSGAVLGLNFGVHVPAEPLSLAGTGQSGFGALSSGFGSNSWAGNITLTSDTTISVDAGDFLNLTGAINGPFDITKTDTGMLILSGGTANSFDGMFVDAGTLVLDKSIANAAGPADLTIGDNSGTDIVRLAADNQIADTTEVHVSLGGRFDLNDMNETTGAIDGRGLIDLGSGILREGADNDSSGFGGLIIGTGSLFKLGTGTWTLTGDNTYTGQTTVSAGTLIVDGSQPQSPVAVNGTANLGGSGVIGNLQLFGSLRPGASPGVLTCSNVNFAAGSDYFVELNGPNPGTGYDQLNVRGTNQLGSSTLHLSVSGLAPFEGQQFVILNNDGAEAIVGTFNGLANGSLITVNGLQFRIRYSDIFLNDVVLTHTNSAARMVSASIAGGNGDGNIDLNECNFLNVVLTNTTGAILSGVSATLFPKTPGVSVMVGTSAYPTMAANGRATNTTPFQFSVGPGFICGTNVDFDLVVQTPADGTFTVPLSFVSGSAGNPLRFNNNTVTAIPDNGSVDLLLNVAGITTPIKRVVVALHITHTAVNDLDISLVGPDGTIVNLSSDNGGTASDYGSDCNDANRTTFNDLALTSITAGSAPFVGTFRPEQPLNVFNEKSGSDANGTWRLRVADDTAGGAGTVRCWSLLISPTACSNNGGGCESCPEDRVIRGTLGIGSLVQTNRLFLNGIKSICGVQKPCPGTAGALGDRYYDAYTFENGESNACITVALQSSCSLSSAAYTNSYNPANLCQNYLADMGGVTTSNSYSFNVRRGARFVVVVYGANPGDACDYTLSVDGGSCRPRLNITQIPGNRVDLDWSSAALGYSLERTNTLRNPAGPLWFTVPGSPLINSGRFHVIENIAPTNNFYRLRKP